VLRSLLALVYFILFYFGTEQNGTTPRRQRFLCHIKHKLFNFFPLTLRELGIYILGSIFFFFGELPLPLIGIFDGDGGGA